MEEQKTLGQVAYEAYCEHTGWKSIRSGEELLQWADQSDAIKEAWEVSADAVSLEVSEALSSQGMAA